jgi:hypothetical protein
MVLASGCAPLPRERAPQNLYLDLRKIVDEAESDGWTVDSRRVDANLEPALRSVCTVEPRSRAELDAWLAARIQAGGGPSESQYRVNGGDFDAVSGVASLERTRLLLNHADRHAASDCPYWLAPRADFTGVQGDFQRWVVLAETQGFLTLLVPGAVPAAGGGGRLLLGRGLGPRTTLALGGELAASATFIPTGSSGIDAYTTVAVPVLYRWSEFSKLFDVELAPLMRFSPGGHSWPPGARVELGYGWSSVTLSSSMSYLMLYAGYEIHGLDAHSSLDQTFQIGTRLGLDWRPGSH